MKFVLILALVVVACQSNPPQTPQASCRAEACLDCEKGCKGNPMCENTCYAHSSQCCMSAGQRGIAFTCGCY